MPKVTITVSEKVPQPYRFQLDREVVSMGRGSENDIVIDSGSVSVVHAEMHRIPGGYELRDLGSTNGITLAGFRQEIIALSNGAAVKLGDVEFDFLLSDDELQVLRTEQPQPGGLLEAGPPPADIAYARPITPWVEEEAVESVQRRSGKGKFLLFVIFLVLAFFGGLAARHHKETGASLLDAMLAHFFN